MKLKLIMLVSVFAFGLAFNANAGAVADGDSDLVPNAFDNCPTTANGPTPGQSNQVDTDLDGYGNACDSDYSTSFAAVAGDGVGANDFMVTGTDFNPFLASFTGAVPDLETDNNGDSMTTTADFTLFLAHFQGLPIGPGLSCAGVTNPCVP